MEGNGAIRLVQLMKKHGFNRDMTVELATVIAPPPQIKIQIDNMKLILEKEDVIVAENLIEHQRDVIINGSQQTIEFNNVLTSGDRVIVLTDSDQIYFVLDRAVL